MSSLHLVVQRRTLFGLAKQLGFGLLLILANVIPCWSAVGVDQVTSTDRSSSGTSIASPSFSTPSANELLLAFISSDGKTAGITVTGVSGGGLTWSLVRRTNGQLGTAEIWRAFAGAALSGVRVTATLSQSVAASITVVTFTGVDTTGSGGSGAIGAIGGNSSSSGAPSTSLVTTRNESLVLGVGNDWDNAIARTLPSNQTLVHQYLATTGDTFWVQRLSLPSGATGTTVTINDTGPAIDRYNLSIVEVLASPVTGATYTVTGSISPAALASGSAIALSQNGTSVASATADSNGNYSFSNVPNGSYTVTPSKAGTGFSPTTQSVTVNGANASVPTFVATAQTQTISGAISPANLGVGTLLTLAGPNQLILTATADAAGNYSFPGLQSGSYTVTPTKVGFTFSPGSQGVSISTGINGTANFTATAIPTFSVSGTVSPAAAGAGTLLTLSGTPSMTTTANSSGNYSFAGLGNGTYTVTPSKTGYTFSPQSLLVVVNGLNVTGVNFSAQPQQTPQLNYPDLSDIIPAGGISIVGTGTSRMFQYTHDTFNGGTGPLVIQPVLNPSSGAYQGIQYIYSFSGGTWTLAQQIPLAGAFIFDAAHGHFHFPFVTYGLYTVGQNGGIGTPVALSPKVSFCINDSFLYAPNLPNAGALGNLGSCSDPTSLRGLNIGAVDEYDQTDEGQSIPLSGVPDGTYWLRALVDPNNFMYESDKSNNETDVKIAISGTSVTVLQTVTPVLPPPPSIALTAPADQVTASGTINLIANPAVVSPVQFLMDGQALGSPVGAPYTFAWDTALVVNGVHWIAAQTTDPASGRIGTSGVARVTVANAGSKPPVVTLTDPIAGSTVSAIVVVGATVASPTSIASVQFYVDGVPMGTALTAAPYLVFWNTLSLTDGQHMLTAAATDSGGLTGTSASVMVMVDNSHLPSAIAIDKMVFQDASGVMTTPAFSTTTSSDLLVAFVGYDGPKGVPQTATVSGGGLAWTLVKRSNLQSGTSEIWAAKAPDFLTNVTVISQPGVSGYHGSLFVVAFTNAAGPGVVGRTSAPSGAPDIPLPGVSAGGWVFAVGNDWDNAIARTPVSGQVLVHQRIDAVTGDTFWVQSTTSPSAASTIVDIHDSAPTSDQWNYSAIEIVPTRQ
jgi:hypothetical protein